MGRAAKTNRQSLLFIDFFGEQIGFNIEGNGKHKSVIGMIVTLVILSTVGAIGVQKFLVMKDYGDTRHAMLIHENALEGQEEKISMTNFDIAVSV